MKGAMTPEAQRIAIAEFCGFRPLFIRDIESNALYEIGDGKQQDRNVPDYLNSLDAMHEAERTLTHSQGLSHFRILRDRFATVMGPKGSVIGVNDYLLVTATAAQRAEALLRTIGKWEEEKP